MRSYLYCFFQILTAITYQTAIKYQTYSSRAITKLGSIIPIMNDS